MMFAEGLRVGKETGKKRGGEREKSGFSSSVVWLDLIYVLWACVWVWGYMHIGGGEGLVLVSKRR